MSMPWNYYVKRRGINIAKFLKSRNCQTYESLCKILAAENIEPPSRKEMEVYFSEVRTRKKPAPKKQTLGTKSSVKAPSRHSRVKDTSKASKPEKKTESRKESEQS